MDTETKKPTKFNYEPQRKKEAELVKGKFKFYEVPGGSIQFSYGPIYKGDKTLNLTLVDGQIYTVPRGVARHLNNNCWYPEYDYIKGEDVRTNYAVKNKVHRTGFQSLEFMDEDMHADTGLVEVKKI